MSDEPIEPDEEWEEPAEGSGEVIAPVGPREDRGGVTAPIVVNLGKQRRRVVKQLERGEGPLMTEVAEVIDEVRTQLGDEMKGKILVPLVMVCRQKRKRKRPRSFLPSP